jgi:hypothetical protein
MRRAVPALALGCWLALAAAGPARGAEYRTVFQNPGTEITHDLSLENHAIALIDATPPGEHVTFAFRDFNRRPVADALIAAHGRGVHVDGVIDGSERNRTVVRELVDTIGPDRVVICGTPTFVFNSCIANSPAPSLQHNKFLTFSGLADGRRDVVLQTSKNFLEPSQLTYYNDMVEIAGDRKLHAAYVKYLFDMKAQLRSNTYYFPASGDDGRNTIFPSPRPQPDLDTDDTIVDRMKEIDCSRGGTIRVANMAFRSERAVIMRKLIGLERDGCDIELIVSNLDGNILAGLVAAGIRVQPFFQRAVSPRQQVIVHSKFWLVDARSTLTGERTRITYAGSSNWRGDQQYSDDLLLRIVDDGVHAAYSSYWELIKSRAVSDQNRPSADTVAPASALTARPEPNAAGWNRSGVTLRVAGSDGHNVGASGLKRLHVRMSGAHTGATDFLGETAGYNVQELTLAAEGETTVSYFSEDVKGNREPARDHVVRVDATAPTIAGLPRRCRLWPPNKRMVHVADVTAADAVSGVADLSISASSNATRDDGDIVIENGSVYLRAEKADRGRTRRYAITATAVDRAGNAQTGSATCKVKRFR